MLLVNKNILFFGWESFNNKRYHKERNQIWIVHSPDCSIQKPTKLGHIDVISKKKYISFQITTFQYKISLENQVNFYISQIPIKLAHTLQQASLQNWPLLTYW